MLLKDRFKLFFECFFPVVFGLVLDVGDRVVDAGHADAEGPISFLPFEPDVLRKRLVNPFRGVALDELHGLCDGQGRGQRQQNVEVVCNPADF